MKYEKLILMGAIAAFSVIPTQAAVYGTLKQDMYFNVGENIVEKASGTGVSIVAEDENNYLICVNQDTKEYVSKHFVKMQGIVTTTKVSDVKVKKAATNQSSVLANLSENELVMALEKQDNYYKVKVNDVVGYIEASHIDTSKLSSLEQEAQRAQKGKEVVAYAKKYLGGRYVFGGNNLNTGVDCSGFVQQIMKHFGVSMARSSREQYRTNGVKVKEAEIMPGDLVYYGNGGTVNHAAIYIGNDQIIHANTESTGIIISDLHYGKPIIGIKRVLK